MITQGNRQVFILIDQLVCLEGYGNYTYLHTNDGQKYLISKTLKSYAGILDAKRFLRVHKSSIVNLDYIKEVSVCDRAILLRNGKEVAIARRRATQVRKIAVQKLNA